MSPLELDAIRVRTPSGTSLGLYTVNPPKPEPIDVAPGKTAKVTVAFDDSK